MRGRSGLTLAALAAVAGIAGLGNMDTRSTEQRAQEARTMTDRTNLPAENTYSPFSLRGILGGHRSYRWNAPNGPGWTVAHVKRMARKTKNRAKHRARVRARGGR